MGGDYSRKTFDPRKNYSGVLMQQGRVLLDADWNELIHIFDRRWRAETIDFRGRFRVSSATPNAFKIISAGPNNFTIGVGRAYLDGLLCENHGNGPITFHSDLGEECGTQPLLYNEQLYSPALPSNGRYIVYLDVWQCEVTHLQDPDMVEPAVDVDTTTRIQTAWQVKFLELDDVSDPDCDIEPDEWKALIQPSAARLSTSITSVPPDTDPCLSPSPSGGYRGLENRLYRVEIHKDGNYGEAQFKWARHNASMETECTAIDGTKIMVAQSKWDDERRFNPGDLVEMTDDARELSGKSGKMIQIETVDFATNTITLNSPLPSADFPTSGSEHLTDPMRHTRIRRWDGLQDVTASPIPLEHGIECTFSKDPDLPDGEFKVGDYWLLHTRTADASVKILNNAPPQGIHHYAKLAVVKPAGIVIDCRPPWPPQTGGGDCCAVTVGDGDRSHGDFDSIAEALLGLPSGAGTICLLLGDHRLREPIDLSNLTGIHIKGLGSVSRLYVADPFEGKAAFILSDTKEVSFEDFAIFNRTAENLWSCEQTEKLVIKNMVVSTTLVKGKHAVISIKGDQCHHWQILNSAFSGPLGMAGGPLSKSLIRDNIFQGTHGGIVLRYMQHVVIEGNRFSALPQDLIEELEFNVADIRRNDGIRRLLFKNIFLRPFMPPKRSEIGPDFVAIEVGGAFKTDCIGNHFQGSVGVIFEIFENGKIDSNEYITRLTGASLGLVKNLRFSENRIGLKGDGRNQETAVQCRLGLAILGDAVDCRIVDNFFENVLEGIAFESDIGGKNATVRDFAVNISIVDNVNPAMAKTILADSKARIKQRQNNLQLLASTYFRIAKCEHILIQNNQFHARQTAIEWSGTKNIIDFRIDNNSFIGCQDTAIQIEPDVFFKEDPVDTKVRLIEKNRFDVYSGAVRATIGAVRIEKNDIRIKAPPMVLAPSKEILLAAAENVYNLAPLTEAVKNNDIPMMRMVDAMAKNAIQKNSNGIDNRGFSINLSDAVLENYATGKGDVWADNAFVMKTIADIEEPDLIAQLVNTNLHKLIVSTEGFAVNLSGYQNRAVHNRIHSDNTQHPGGIVFQALSGKVWDNEVSVPGWALLLNGKAGVPSARQGVEIIGNSLTVTASGIPGEKKAVYALSMPSLSPGNISISNNQFKGSVMIGGDPISAQGLAKKENSAISDMIINYHAIKYDMSTYVNAAHAKVFPVQSGSFDPFSPPSILFPAWSTAPHTDRPVIQFSNNRVIKGWLGIFQALSGAYWTESMLKKWKKKALIAYLNGNILDYGGSVVGYDVIIVGNHSQLALKYRAGRKGEAVANMPEARSF